MENVLDSKVRKNLKKMLTLRETLKSVITFDKTGEICSEFVGEAEANGLDLLAINTFLTKEESRDFGCIFIRELSLLRLEHDLPIELKNHREEHMSKIFMIIGLTGQIEEYFIHHADLNLDAKDTPWVFSKYTALKALEFSFRGFNKTYSEICKTSYIKPLDISYLECEGAKDFFSFIDRINKFVFEYYNKELMARLMEINKISEEDLKRIEEEQGPNKNLEALEEKKDYFINKPPKEEKKKKD